MLALPPFIAAFAAAAAVLGLRLLLVPLLDATRWYWRALVLAGVSILAWRYMIWRLTETVAPLDWTIDALVSWTFALLELLGVVSSTISFFILTRVRNRSEDATRNEGWWKPGPAPRVDVFIATYNEQLEVLERTIVGAKALNYQNLRVFVLDDGRRRWLKETCDSHGIGYLTRPDNAHAKAGNMNHALHLRAQDPDRPDFIAVLDADFVPHREFVDRVLALFKDRGIGLVQTPQHFFNPDPIQHNLGISAGYPDEQRHFFDNVEASRDAWSIAVCCGTSSMVRVEALQAIGGFPTESVTEDFLLSLRLSERGWQTAYLNEPLTEGLAPEGLHEYIVQRGRWCLGMMQIVRNVYNPVWNSSLRLIDRISILDSFLYWVSTFPFRIACLLCPLLYWWFGIIVVNATVEEIVRVYLPYYIGVTAAMHWLARGMLVPVLNDVGQLLPAMPICRAVAIGLWSRGPHKFSVTAKGGDRTRTVVQWPILWPFLALFLATLGGLSASLWSDFLFNHAAAAGDGMVVIAFWTVYNLIVLLVTMAACIERPRINQPQRQTIEDATLTIDGRKHRVWVLDLGVDGARISGPSGLTAGSSGNLRIPEVGEVLATIREPTSEGYWLRLEPLPEQRNSLIARLHTSNVRPGTGMASIPTMIREFTRTLTS